jgi:5'(3')-deoxyribonucleotidase
MGMGGDPFVVTARTESIRSRGTASWLAAHLPEIDYASRVRFTNHYVAGGVGKGEVCRSIGADILIDDNIEFIRDAAACGVVGILLDKPWNRNYEIPDTAVRVSGWDEIPAMVERIRKRTP